MKVDSPVRQLEAAATRAGLIAMFGPLEFEGKDVEALESCGEGDEADVGFGNHEGPLGVLHVDLIDSGDPEDGGLAVRLRGWKLDDDVASV